MIIYFEDLVKKATDDIKKLKRDYSTLEFLRQKQLVLKFSDLNRISGSIPRRKKILKVLLYIV